VTSEGTRFGIERWIRADGRRNPLRSPDASALQQTFGNDAPTAHWD
jgi:hypothetical protein